MILYSYIGILYIGNAVSAIPALFSFFLFFVLYFSILFIWIYLIIYFYRKIGLRSRFTMDWTFSGSQYSPCFFLLSCFFFLLLSIAFTRWCNTYLVERMLKVESLSTDLADGVNLCNLLEIISSKQIKYNKQPKLLMQKLGITSIIFIIYLL